LIGSLSQHSSVMQLTGLALLIGLIATWEPGAVVFAASGSPPAAAVQIDTAAVTLDGRVLFRVRGVWALSAQTRAAAIAEHIRALAEHSSSRIAAVQVLEKNGFTEI